MFSASVQKRTGRTLTLPTDGYFSPADVRSALSGVPSGTHEALVSEWGRLTVAAKEVGEKAAKEAFGDLSKFDPAKATTGEKIAHRAEQGLREVVPFSSWYLRAMPIAAKFAADQPAYTLALLGVLVDSAKDTKEQGLPSYLAGKVPFGSDTPVVRKLADVLTPGVGGATGFGNVLGGLLPLKTESLSGDGGDGEETPYQTVERWAERAGFGFNPLVKAIMYAANQDYQRPSALSRTAGIAQAFDGPTLPSIAQGPLDTVRKLAGGSVSTTTPTERRLAQIFYENTGMRIGDPAAAALAAQTLDPQHPWYRQAVSESKESGAPIDVTAQGDLDSEIAKAKEAQKAAGIPAVPPPPTPGQVARDALLQKQYPLQYLLEQRAKEAATPIDPPTQVYRGADQRGRACQAVRAREEENAGLKHLAPSAFNVQRSTPMEMLGLGV